jgi:hypothetical protein
MPKSQFNRAQNDFIESFLTEFVTEMDKGVSGAKLTQWKQSKASIILDSKQRTDPVLFSPTRGPTLY